VKHAVQCAIVAASLIIGLLAQPAQAQIEVGENTSMSLTGDLAFGYDGNYSNLGPSSHSLSPSGDADLSGYYYSPNFVSFDVKPFYNQSRANSTYQSVFQAGGVNASSSIFSGSHFPGSVSYSRIYDSQGGYSLPGVGNLTTRGNSDNFNLGWGIQVPDYPRVGFQFTDGDSTSSVYGTNADSSFHSKMVGVVASHNLDGFNLNGGYHYNTTHGVTPGFLEGEPSQTASATSNSFDFNVQHNLPFHGSFSVGASRAMVNSESSGSNFSGNIDTVGSGVNFSPVGNLNVNFTAQYTNNLEGSVYQSVITSGGIVPAQFLNYSTHSLDLDAQANYIVPSLHLTIIGSADRREQTMLGSSISADSYNEMVTYGNDFMKGFISATAGASETSVNTLNGSVSHGYFGNVSYNRKLQNWTLSGSGNYSRNTQTILIGYTSSGYGYSVGVGRKFNAYSYWSFNASETKSVFNNIAGSDSLTQNYSSSISLRHFALSGSFGKSDGTSLLTPTGLTPVSNPIPVNSPLEEIVFNGKYYSFGASTTPRRGLVLTASYSRTRSYTSSLDAASENTTAQLNTMLQYKVRQLWITGGYLRLQQGFSITGQPMASDTAFFVGIARWFKFF